MSTNAQVAAELLKQVAGFLRDVGKQNPDVAEKMSANALTYERVAELMENDPEGSIAEPPEGSE